MTRNDVETIKTLTKKSKLVEQKQKFDPEDEEDIIDYNNKLIEKLDDFTSNIVTGIEEKEQQIAKLSHKILSANITLKKLKARGYKLKISKKLTVKKSWK